MDARNQEPSELEFKVMFMKKYGKNPDTKEDITDEEIRNYEKNI